MSHGLPRTAKEVLREAAKLGYKHEHTTGGHMFYTKAKPDASLGQSAKLCIPTNIKAEKTLRSILKGMGYFKAHNLDHAGQPLAKTPDAATPQQPDASRFVRDMRQWKRDMKRHVRGLADRPGAQP